MREGDWSCVHACVLVTLHETDPEPGFVLGMPLPGAGDPPTFKAISRSVSRIGAAQIGEPL